MVPPASKAQTVTALVDTVTKANGSMLVGMFGIKWFLMALAEAGHVEEAFNSIATTTYPSYGCVGGNELCATPRPLPCLFGQVGWLASWAVG
jgi:hypothetical protein